MRTVIIANPKAAAGRVRLRWHDFNRALVSVFGPSEVRLTEHQGEATLLCRRAILEGAERIVAVGGDGTLNEVVNGFFDEAGERCLGEHVSLALYPAGTGGDTARSLGLHGSNIESVLRQASDRRIDIGRAVFRDAAGHELRRHFINECSLGMSGMISREVNNTSKRFGGKVSFYVGTLKGFARFSNQRVRLRVDDHFDEEVVIKIIAMTNGRYFGGGMKIAPQAYMNDGVFEIIVVGDVSLGTFLRHGTKVYSGKHLSIPGIRALRGRVVTVTPMGSEPVLVDADGEQPGKLPLRCEVLPGAIKMFAPWERAEALKVSVELDKSNSKTL